MQAASEYRTTATHYGVATEGLESTAKWLVTAFAAVGALVIGGVQLSGLGALGRSELPRLSIAVASLIVAILAVAYMIRETSAIFMTEWVTLAALSLQAFQQELKKSDGEPSTIGGAEASALSAEIASAIREVEASGVASNERRDLRVLLDEINSAKEELYAHVARSIPDLHFQLRKANQCAAEVTAGEVQTTWPDQEKVFRKVHELRNAARDVVECANYHRTRQDFNDLKKRLRWAVAVVAISTLVFAYVINPPLKNEPVQVQPVKVELVTPNSAP